jgi:hypothetical protein
VNRLHATTASNPARSAVRDAIFRDAEDFYTTPGDLNIDVWSMAEVVRARFSYADAQASALKSAVDDAVIEEWHHGQGNPGARGIAVHFVPLTAGGNPTDHADEYRRGAIPGQLDFVGTSSWVPVDPAGPGLLYRLWYETLP